LHRKKVNVLTGRIKIGITHMPLFKLDSYVTFVLTRGNEIVRVFE